MAESSFIPWAKMYENLL